MSLGGLVAGLIILAALLLWVLLPFVQRHTTHTTDEVVDRQRERLQVYYNRVLRNVHDLDEDYATGKLNEADYLVDREIWVQRGIQALKAIDDLQAHQLDIPVDADDATIDEVIEEVINAREL